jgi:hypothetical protein
MLPMNVSSTIQTVPICLLTAMLLLADDAAADTIYHCGFQDGAPVFTFNTRPPGRKCRVYSTSSPAEKDAVPKGARCKIQRFRDTVFHACEKDGIWWYYNRNPDRSVSEGRPAASTAMASEPGGAPVAVGPSAGGSTLIAQRVARLGLDDVIRRASSDHGIPEALLRAVIEVESGFNPDVVSPAGAQGLMQLMPVTAGHLNVEDPFDPEQNVLAGARLLRILSDRFHGDVERTVAAYYAGAGAVRRAGGIPTESAQVYVRKVLQRYRKYANQS